MSLEAATVVRLVNGKFLDIAVDIPYEIIVLDYPDTLEAEPRVVFYKRSAGISTVDAERIEQTLESYRPK